MHRWRVSLAAVTALLGVSGMFGGGCASSQRNADGTCKTYKPLSMCTPGFHEACEVTRDGCEQCSCVPDQQDRFGPDLRP